MVISNFLQTWQGFQGSIPFPCISSSWRFWAKIAFFISLSSLLKDLPFSVSYKMAKDKVLFRYFSSENEVEIHIVFWPNLIMNLECYERPPILKACYQFLCQWILQLLMTKNQISKCWFFKKRVGTVPLSPNFMY